MSYTIQRVQKEFREICNKAGVKCTIPITINERLTRTLGRVFCSYVGDKCIATRAEFSKQLLETATDESIYSVIQHEACHYIATTRTGEHHGHDAYFKSVCKEIGCTNDKTDTYIERTVERLDVYKYIVYCPNCGEIAYYSRKGRVLQNISACTCGRCGSGDLWYEEK